MGKGLTYQALFEQPVGFTENDLPQSQAGYITSSAKNYFRFLFAFFWCFSLWVWALIHGEQETLLDGQLFCIYIQEVGFKVSCSQFPSFKKGDPYTIHFLPNGKWKRILGG